MSSPAPPTSLHGVRVVFAGSPEVALPALEVVAQRSSELLVISQPDRPTGRKGTLTPTAVSRYALDHSLPLERPGTADQLRDCVADFMPDLGITVAYGRILRPEVLELPRLGWWNLHFSLLPRWRGAAPVQHALLAGDTTTGVTIFALDAGIDTGPVLHQEDHPIRPGMTAGELLGQLSRLGARALNTTLDSAEAGNLRPTAQAGPATHAPKLVREDGRVSSQLTVAGALRRFGASTPEPGCFLTLTNQSLTMTIHQMEHNAEPVGLAPGHLAPTRRGVAMGLSDGEVTLLRVQPAGKRAMSALDWWRGVHGNPTVDA